MPSELPAGSELSVSEARAQLPDMVNRAEYADQVTYLIRRGRGRVAAVVPLEVVEAAARWEDQELGRLADEARAEMGAGAPAVPLDSVLRDLDL
ncbi:MAG: hypothetical protein ACRDTQ_03185 [Micromonosporaceae bacterium]